VPDIAAFDPERQLLALHRNGLRYVLIGAVAARLQGFPRMTARLDITPARDADNLEKLAGALRKLDARVYTESVPEGLPFDWSPKALGQTTMWKLTTIGGRLDVVFEPAGTGGFADLIGSAVRFHIFGAAVDAASLEDIIRSKKAADRPQDRQDVVVLQEMVRRQHLAQAAENPTPAP